MLDDEGRCWSMAGLRLGKGCKCHSRQRGDDVGISSRPRDICDLHTTINQR